MNSQTQLSEKIAQRAPYVYTVKYMNPIAPNMVLTQTLISMASLHRFIPYVLRADYIIVHVSRDVRL